MTTKKVSLSVSAGYRSQGYSSHVISILPTRSLESDCYSLPAFAVTPTAASSVIGSTRIAVDSALSDSLNEGRRRLYRSRS